MSEVVEDGKEMSEERNLHKFYIKAKKKKEKKKSYLNIKPFGFVNGLLNIYIQT